MANPPGPGGKTGAGTMPHSGRQMIAICHETCTICGRKEVAWIDYTIFHLLYSSVVEGCSEKGKARAGEGGH